MPMASIFPPSGEKIDAFSDFFPTLRKKTPPPLVQPRSKLFFPHAWIPHVRAHFAHTCALFRTECDFAHTCAFRTYVRLFRTYVRFFRTYVRFFRTYVRYSHIRAYFAHTCGLRTFVRISHICAIISHIRAIISHIRAILSHIRAFLHMRAISCFAHTCDYISHAIIFALACIFYFCTYVQFFSFYTYVCILEIFFSRVYLHAHLFLT